MGVYKNNRFNFPLLCTSQLISQFGDSVFHIGLLWLALELTQSNSLSSLIAAAGYLPAILLSLAAGVVADRVDRRKLMIACAFGQALSVGLVPVLHSCSLLSGWVLATVTFCVSTGAAFFNPARDSLTPLLVAPKQLTRANSLIQASAQLAFLAGPLAAGLLASWLGTIHLFSIDSLTFIASMIMLAAIRVTPKHPAHITAGPVRLPQLPPSTGGSMQDLTGGLIHAWKDKRLRGLLILTSVENLIIMGPAILGTPIYVRDVLGYWGKGLGAYSMLVGVFFAGMVTASLIIGFWGRGWPKGKLIITGMILDGITFIPFFFIHTLGLACLSMFLHGLTVPLITVPRATLIQQIVPEDRRGRIFALVNLAVVGCTALSVVFTGLASEKLGMGEIYLIIGLLGTACGLIGYRFKSLWNS